MHGNGDGVKSLWVSFGSSEGVGVAAGVKTPRNRDLDVVTKPLRLSADEQLSWTRDSDGEPRGVRDEHEPCTVSANLRVRSTPASIIFGLRTGVDGNGDGVTSLWYPFLESEGLKVAAGDATPRSRDMEAVAKPLRPKEDELRSWMRLSDGDARGLRDAHTPCSVSANLRVRSTPVSIAFGLRTGVRLPKESKAGERLRAGVRFSFTLREPKAGEKLRDLLCSPSGFTKARRMEGVGVPT